MIEVVIASAIRTPIGKYGKALRDVPAPRLGGLVVRAAVERASTRISKSHSYHSDIGQPTPPRKQARKVIGNQ